MNYAELPQDGRPWRPLAGRIILEIEKEPEKVGSLFIPDKARDKGTPAMWAKVIGVGYGPYAMNEEGRVKRYHGVTPEDIPEGARVVFRPLIEEVGKHRIITDVRRVDAVMEGDFPFNLPVQHTPKDYRAPITASTCNQAAEQTKAKTLMTETPEYYSQGNKVFRRGGYLVATFTPIATAFGVKERAYDAQEYAAWSQKQHDEAQRREFWLGHGYADPLEPPPNRLRHCATYSEYLEREKEIVANVRKTKTAQ